MITEQTRVAAVAAESLAAISVFQAHGIDFCCGGQRPLGAVCSDKGLAPEELIGELAAALAGPKQDETDWNHSPLRDLMAHIVDRHHGYLRSELPRIQAWLDKVSSKYGAQDAESIGRLPDVFGALRAELESHLAKEEMILFPWIEKFESAVESGKGAIALPFGKFDNPMSCMEAEHESAGAALQQMRTMTNAYRPPEHACRTYQALYEALSELETDLHLHIHLENNVLHRRARKLYDEATEKAEVNV